MSGVGAGEMRHVVVVGSSLAGVRACAGLRSGGFAGEITMIGAERHEPYDRPPLSKKVLSGEWEPDRIALIRPADAATLQIDKRFGVAAVALSTTERIVTLADRSTVSYDGLVIATGASLRRLPDQPEHPCVFELRTLDDSIALRERLVAADLRVTIIGAGFIGLEVAATARQLGNTVTVLEGAPAPLIRGLGATMGTALGSLHADHGVSIRCGVEVRGIRPGPCGVDVHLAGDGEASEVISGDIVVVGVGVAPATQWLHGSGLQLRDGVVCDETLNAGVPGVYAAGDVARWPNGQFNGEEMRVEHWTNASEQGLAAASNLLAVANDEPTRPFTTVPFFWSDQYGQRIQMLGRTAGDDDVVIVKGSVEERRFLALYARAGRLRAALALAMPKQLIRCRAMFDEQLSLDEAIESVATIN